MQYAGGVEGDLLDALFDCRPGWTGRLTKTEMEWSEVKSNKFRLVSAAIGAGAVLAMGGFGVAFSEVSAAEEPTPAPPGPVTTSEITTGATATDSAEENGPPTSVVVPPTTTAPSTAGAPGETH